MAAREAFGSNGRPDLFLHGGTYRLVQVTLRAFELDRSHDHCLRRQFGGDLILAPAQHERADAPREQFTPYRIAALFDGVRQRR